MKSYRKLKLQGLIQDAIASNRLHTKDVGSTAVQISVMDVKIACRQEHIKQHANDKHNIKKLVDLVRKRNKLHKYLVRTSSKS